MKSRVQTAAIYTCSFLFWLTLDATSKGADQDTAASIEVDPGVVTGHVSPYFFGQLIEYEHNTIQGGLWAELLRDRKFEQGDADGDGVSNGWVPEERIQDRYWEIQNGRAANVKYFIDRQNYYGGGASQAIQLYGPGAHHASIYQIGLQVAKGRRYVFYVFLKRRGSGKVYVELDKLRGPVNVLLRRADQIFTAEASTTLNVQGLIQINPVAIKLTPPYFAYVLYANHIGSRVVSCRTRSPNVAFDPELPALDAVTTSSGDGKTLFLAVINHNERDAVSSRIDLKTWRLNPGQRLRAFELDGKDRDSANSYGSVENVNIQEKDVLIDRAPLNYGFPPHSVTVLQFDAAD